MQILLNRNIFFDNRTRFAYPYSLFIIFFIDKQDESEIDMNE